MNFVIDEFLQSFMAEKIFFKKIKIYFKGDDYPCLFFSLFFNFLKKNNDIQINHVNVEETDLSILKLNLEQFMFGGSELFFWLGDISNFKKKDEIISYVNTYNGPYSIAYFNNSDQDTNMDEQTNIVNCNYITSIEQLNSFLCLWSKKEHKKILSFMKKILQQCSKLHLDQLCIFANYAILLGTKYESFIDNWLENILVGDYSLFTLSKYFFSKDSTSFFKYWNLIRHNYAPVFWTSFWSEQLYRAINFIHLRNQNKNLQAKQIAYKLPFSFIQNDWKKFSILELQKLHQFIYEIDYSLKNGGTDVSLDLFYARFFEKTFR